MGNKSLLRFRASEKKANGGDTDQCHEAQEDDYDPCFAGGCLLHGYSLGYVLQVQYSKWRQENEAFFEKKKEAMEKTLDLLGKILTEIPIYRLSCDMTEEAVKTSYNGMKV